MRNFQCFLMVTVASSNDKLSWGFLGSKTSARHKEEYVYRAIVGRSHYSLTLNFLLRHGIFWTVDGHAPRIAFVLKCRFIALSPALGANPRGCHIFGSFSFPSFLNSLLHSIRLERSPKLYLRISVIFKIYFQIYWVYCCRSLLYIYSWLIASSKSGTFPRIFL